MNFQHPYKIKTLVFYGLTRAMWPRQESNLDLELRKLLYYPLYDEAGRISNIQHGILNDELMRKLYNITPKYLYRYSDQNYAKKFSYHRQPVWPQCPFYPLQ